MVEQVYLNIFRFNIPIPENPLKAVNAYLIRGRERHLMIDTGMNRPECREAMEADLRTLNVDLRRTDFFITHLHSDHLGLAPYVATEGSRIFLGAPDCRTMNDPDIWDKLKKIAGTNGFPPGELDAAIEKNPGRKYQALGPIDFTEISEGDIMQVGDYTFTPIMTPGHTCGHFCLYEPQRKMLFSGDHLLEDITPLISVLYEGSNPLGQYLDSLNKIARFEIHWVFPGHRSKFTRCTERIAEMKYHIKTRSEEVLSILEAAGRQSAYEVASKMTWDVDPVNWNEVALTQRWFAAGEALAYLGYLQAEGRITKEMSGGKAYYSLNEKSCSDGERTQASPGLGAK